MDFTCAQLWDLISAQYENSCAQFRSDERNSAQKSSDWKPYLQIQTIKHVNCVAVINYNNQKILRSHKFSTNKFQVS